MSKIQLPISNPEYSAETPAARALTRAEGGDVMTEIRHEVTSNRIFLYMKGTPQMPMCGFSARVAQILAQVGAKYGSCNILEDPEKREAIKKYGNWPTIPQLYVNGELVGGCDIVTDMYQSGELQELLG